MAIKVTYCAACRRDCFFRAYCWFVWPWLSFLSTKACCGNTGSTELKNDFIRNMTHELKTPIATVSVAVEALQKFDALQNPQRTQEYLDIAGMELNRLSLLVDKVLRISLFEKQEPVLRSEPIDLKILVEEILTPMRLQFEKCRAQVQILPEGNFFALKGDRLHLVSVVYNLLDNALKYSTQHPEIKIGITHGNQQLSLRVEDNGIGIPQAFQARTFEKFFRVPTGDVHHVKGHGLGLSYVAGVVRLHGGSIEVESRKMRALVLRLFCLLKNRPHYEKNKNPLRRRRTLLGKIVTESLESRQFEVHLVADGREVMAAFWQFKPDICVLDVMLPHRDGFSLGQEIRQQNPQVPIILTAKNQTQDVVQGFKSGGNDYIRKPFSQEELIVRIQNLLRMTGTAAPEPSDGLIRLGRYRFAPLRQELHLENDFRTLSHRETRASWKYSPPRPNEVVQRKDILLQVWDNDSF